jgi:hypothetical protein
VTRKKDNVANKVTNVISVTLRIPRTPLTRVRNISALYVITKKAQIMPLLVSHIIWLKHTIFGHTSISILKPCFMAHIMEVERQLQFSRPFVSKRISDPEIIRAHVYIEIPVSDIFNFLSDHHFSPACKVKIIFIYWSKI